MDASKFQSIVEYFRPFPEFVGAEIRENHMYVYVSSAEMANELDPESRKYGITIMRIMPKRQK